jgi:hypothetical protein
VDVNCWLRGKIAADSGNSKKEKTISCRKIIGNKMVDSNRKDGPEFIMTSEEVGMVENRRAMIQADSAKDTEYH